MVELVRRTGGLDVATEQPHELVRLVLGGVGDTLVVVVCLTILRSLQLGTELFMKVLESGGEISSSWDSGAVGDLRVKCRVEAVVGKEGGLVGGGIDVVVEGEFCERQIIDPVVLLIRRVPTEVRLYDLVRALCESVGLWMISS